MGSRNNCHSADESLFWYWINERQRIYIRKEISNEPPPWTKDPILSEYKFTNVFRTQDRVTRDWADRIGKFSSLSNAEIFWRTCLFRMFNLTSTYDALRKTGLVNQWSEAKAKATLGVLRAQGVQVFTGAFIITNQGQKRPKIDLVCEALTEMWEARRQAVKFHAMSLREATDWMQRFPMVGKFIAYEIVTDLRHTKLLCEAPDIMTWANPGPGAHRGLCRLYAVDRMTHDDCVQVMQQLLRTSQVHGLLSPHVPALEMRDIEHSLCEFDKYCRVKFGEGRPRSKYKYE